MYQMHHGTGCLLEDIHASDGVKFTYVFEVALSEGSNHIMEVRLFNRHFRHSFVCFQWNLIISTTFLRISCMWVPNMKLTFNNITPSWLIAWTKTMIFFISRWRITIILLTLKFKQVLLLLQLPIMTRSSLAFTIIHCLRSISTVINHRLNFRFSSAVLWILSTLSSRSIFLSKERILVYYFGAEWRSFEVWDTLVSVISIVVRVH